MSNELGLEIIRRVQSIHNEVFDVLFQFITMFGEEIIIISILGYIYWNVDKKLGELIAYTSFTSLLINNTIKGIVNAKRPIGEKGIRVLRAETATGSSFPSGHSQNASVFYSTIARIYKNKKLYIFASIIIPLVGLSRLYCGVHYPRDVIVGIFLGLIVSYICYKLYYRVNNKLSLYIVTFIIFIPVIITAGSIDLIKGMGTFLGFIIGVYLEKRYVNFNNNVNRNQKIMRLVLGLVCLLIIKIGFKIIFPQTLTFDFIRYGIIGIFAIAGWPYIFKKFEF